MTAARPALRAAAPVLLLAGLAAIVRIAIAARREWIGYDEANYLMIGRNAAAGAGYVQSTLAGYAAKFHPLSFLLPKWVVAIVGDEILASNVIYVVSGGVVVLLVAALGTAMFGRRVGLAAAGLASVMPVLASLLVESISHSVFLPPFLAGICLVWVGVQHGRILLAAAAGAAIGVAWWARADGLPVALVVVGYFATVGGWRRGAVWGLGAAGAFAAGFLILLAAYAVFVHVASHGVVASDGPMVHFAVRPLPCQVAAGVGGYDSLARFAVDHPACLLERMAANAKTIPSVLLPWNGFPMMLLLFVGAAFVLDDRIGPVQASAHLLLGLVAVVPLALYLPFYYEETRYVAPYAALGLVWVARGALGVGDRLFLRGRPLGSSVVVGLALVFGVVLTASVRRGDYWGGKEYVETGRWIERHARDDTVVWTSQSEVAFFARRPWYYPPAPGDGEAWRRLGGPEVFLVVDDRFFTGKNPAWAPIVLRPSNAALELVFESGAEAPRVRVYRVRPEARRAARVEAAPR